MLWVLTCECISNECSQHTVPYSKHSLELYDKLVSPILNDGAEVWGFCKANQIERVHMQFCKRLLGVKKSTQNNFIYGELFKAELSKSKISYDY